MSCRRSRFGREAGGVRSAPHLSTNSRRHISAKAVAGRRVASLLPEAGRQVLLLDSSRSVLSAPMVRVAGRVQRSGESDPGSDSRHGKVQQPVPTSPRLQSGWSLPMHDCEWARPGATPRITAGGNGHWNSPTTPDGPTTGHLRLREPPEGHRAEPGPATMMVGRLTWFLSSVAMCLRCGCGPRPVSAECQRRTPG